MNLLCLAPEHNTEGKKDASGAFVPEARAFAQLHGGHVAQVDNNDSYPARRAQSIRLISEHVSRHGPLDAAGIFCHGWPTGLQLGFRSAQAPLLARTLTQGRAAGRDTFVVVLYACDAGRDADDDRTDDQTQGIGGEGGFADLLCAAIGNLGHRARVLAHVTVGHTTTNPWLRVFSTDDQIAGGVWIVPPKSPLWGRWHRALQQTDLRFRVPFMSPSQVLAELTAQA